MREKSPFSFDLLEHALIPGTAVVLAASVGIYAAWCLGALFPALMTVSWWLIPWCIALSILGTYAYYLITQLRTPTSLSVALTATAMGLSTTLLRWDMGHWPDRPVLLLSIFPYLLTWLTAAQYGSATTSLGRLVARVGDRAAATLSWHEQPLSLGADRLVVNTLGLLFALAIGGGITTIYKALPPYRLYILPGLVGGCAMILSSLAHLHQLRLVWGIQKTQVDPRLMLRWLSMLVVLTLLFVFVAALLPHNWLRIPWSTIGARLSSWLRQLPSSSTPNRIPAPSPAPGPLSPPVMEGEANLLVAILFLSVLLLTGLFLAAVLLAGLGMVLYTFFRQETERVPALLRWPVQFYFLTASAVRQILAALRRLRQSRPKRLDPPNNKPKPSRNEVRPPTPLSPQGQRLHDLLLQLVTKVAERGIDVSPGHTARQICQNVIQQHPQTSEMLDCFLSAYLQARYSKTALSAKEYQIARTAWQTAIDKINDKRAKNEEDDNR